jgi:hypothetical protein
VLSPSGLIFLRTASLDGCLLTAEAISVDDSSAAQKGPVTADEVIELHRLEPTDMPGHHAGNPLCLRSPRCRQDGDLRRGRQRRLQRSCRECGFPSRGRPAIPEHRWGPAQRHGALRSNCRGRAGDGLAQRPIPTCWARCSSFPSVCNAGATITSAFWNSFMSP